METAYRLHQKTPMVVLCNPQTRRIELLSRSLIDLGLPAPRLISYTSVLEQTVDLASEIPAGSIVKLESPGKNSELERQLLILGEDRAQAEGALVISAGRLAEYDQDGGEILAPRQWYYGWCHLLSRIKNAVEHVPQHLLMSHPDDVALMFDKPSCQAALAAGGFAIPETFGTITCFDELQELIDRHGCRRLFLKIANGSSGSGVVAYQTDGNGRHKAITTSEICEQSGQLRLYNSRKMQVYSEVQQVRKLIDALGKHVLHVERWFPKAAVDANKVFDLRVVVIGGKVKQVVARASHTPITNLHLLNERLEFSQIKHRIADHTWSEVVDCCERIMETVFPSSLYAGIDVLIGRSLRDYAIAEVNAFGDQLNGILFEGMTTYQTEALHALKLRSLIG